MIYTSLCIFCQNGKGRSSPTPITENEMILFLKKVLEKSIMRKPFGLMKRLFFRRTLA
jgi:hypothetical protein